VLSGAKGGEGPASLLGECPNSPGPGGNASPLLAVVTSPGAFQFLFLGHPPWLGGGPGPGEPFLGDRNKHRALVGIPPSPLLRCPVLLKEGPCRGSCATSGQPGRTRGSRGSLPRQHALQGVPYRIPPGAQHGDKPRRRGCSSHAKGTTFRGSAPWRPRRSTGPSFSSRRGNGSWPNDQELLRGALAHPLFCGNGHRTRRDLHLLCRPVSFLLTVHSGTAALLVTMQGGDRVTRLCLCRDFRRQGRPPPRHNRHCWPGRRGGRLGGTGQGKPRSSTTCHGVGSPTTGCGRYPNLSDERRGAALLRGRIALHITRQLLKMRFPKLVRNIPLHWRERGEGANGGQGFPEVVHTLGSQARAMGRHRSAI
jgi:hypothetical protein